ncbi:MAG: DUF1987 domain-containing protein [Bacteroidales bacterium]|nr:DUF1987 domain-containing protein [Bacteroidales bacterium]
MMEKLEITGTAKTPTIIMDAVSGELLFEGRSNPENANELYEPVIRWLDRYVEQPAAHTHLKLNLELFNTSSSKYILEVLKKIRYLADNNHPFNVTWMYEDDDLEMIDTAEAFEMMTGLRFEKVSYPEGGYLSGQQ